MYILYIYVYIDIQCILHIRWYILSTICYEQFVFIGSGWGKHHTTYNVNMHCVCFASQLALKLIDSLC
jgi:hypothetical protein